MRFNFEAYAEMNPKPDKKQVVTAKVKNEDVMVDPPVDDVGGKEDGDSGIGEPATE